MHFDSGVRLSDIRKVDWFDAQFPLLEQVGLYLSIACGCLFSMRPLSVQTIQSSFGSSNKECPKAWVDKFIFEDASDLFQDE